VLHRTWSVRLGGAVRLCVCALADVYPSEDWNRASILCDGSGPESSEWCREYRLMLGRRFDRATHEI
jgi:hypothetical protein